MQFKTQKKHGSSFNGVYQAKYDGHIIFRIFGENENNMRDFHAEYVKHCQRGHMNKPRMTPQPTEQQKQMAKMWKEGAVRKDVANQFGVSGEDVDKAVYIVSRWLLETSF